MADGRTVPQDNLIGTTIDDNIRILAAIGSGGMGSLYLAEHGGLGKQVAVKVLHGGSTLVSQVLKRFQLEAATLRMLDHPNVVRVYKFGVLEDAGRPYLVLEFLAGGSLAELLDAKGSLPLSSCWALFEQLSAGLAHAHEKGILHRDLKPANVMFASSPQLDDLASANAKIVDFGIAKILEGASSSQKLTQTGALIGTPAYMSPEQLEGRAAAKSADVYALGAILFECLYGKPPVSGENIIEIAINQAQAPLVVPEKTPLKEDVPVALRALIRKLLEPDPEKRIEDGPQLKGWLAQVKSAPDAVPDELKETAGRPRRIKFSQPARNARRAAVVACAIAVVVLIGIGIQFEQRRRFESDLNSKLAMSIGAATNAPRQYAESARLLRDCLKQSQTLPNSSGLRKAVYDSVCAVADSLGQDTRLHYKGSLDDCLWIATTACDLPLTSDEFLRKRACYCAEVIKLAAIRYRQTKSEDALAIIYRRMQQLPEFVAALPPVERNTELLRRDILIALNLCHEAQQASFVRNPSLRHPVDPAKSDELMSVLKARLKVVELMPNTDGALATHLIQAARSYHSRVFPQPREAYEFAKHWESSSIWQDLTGESRVLASYWKVLAIKMIGDPKLYPEGESALEPYVAQYENTPEDKLPKLKNLTDIYFHLGYMRLMQGKCDEALRPMHRAYELALKYPEKFNDDPNWIIDIESSLARVARGQKQFALAKSYIKKARAHLKSRPNDGARKNREGFLDELMKRTDAHDSNFP